MTTTLYTPYKSIGLVTDGKPFVINDLGGETFITASTGDAFQVYRASKLSLCLVSRKVPCGRAITALQASGHDSFVAVDSLIYVYNRVENVRVYREHRVPILGMLLVGSLLLSYDGDNIVSLIDVKARELEGTFSLNEEKDEKHIDSGRKVSACCHPMTYVNKFVFAFSDGGMELWNIRKKKRVYAFESHLACLKELNQQHGHICAMQESPAVDVIAIGFTSGTLMGINLRLDKVIFCFQQEGGHITSLSFRSDVGNSGNPHLATGDSEGRVHIWKLGGAPVEESEDQPHSQSAMSSSSSNEDAKLDSQARGLHIIMDAHTKALGGVQFLYGEPILLTAAADNSLKMWIFDSADGSARLLKSREGHSGFATTLQFYGGMINASMRESVDASSCEILSSGSDGSLRVFNAAVEAQNREFSQRPILAKLGMRARGEKLGNIGQVDCSEARESDWANVASCHQNSANVHLWRYRKNSVTETYLRPPECVSTSSMTEARSTTAFHATSVAMTACGNFCVVGTKSGRVYIYNVQSGQYRGTFPANAVAHGDSSRSRNTKRSKIPGNIFYEGSKLIQGSDSKGSEQDESKPVMLAHEDTVTGIFVDIANTRVVSCSMDGSLAFWNFEDCSLIERKVLESPIQLMTGFRDAELIAVATMDRRLMIFDVVTRNVMRTFKGHSREITAIKFTPDGHRFFSASMDSTLRIWDMVTARCLSWLSFVSPISSMALSLSGEFLVVSMMNKTGLFMYADRSMYENFMFDKEPTCATPVGESNALAEDNMGNIEDDVELTDDGIDSNGTGDGAQNETSNSAEALTTAAQEMASQVRCQQREKKQGQDFSDLTFATTLRAYWTGLFQLEEIRLRNKPTEAQKDRVEAPFFLPSLQNTAVLSGSAPALKSAWSDTDGIGSGNPEEPSAPTTTSRIMKGFTTMSRCRLAEYLSKGDDDVYAVITFLKSQLPSAVDVEFRSLCLSATDIEGCKLLQKLLKTLAAGLKRRDDYEVTQAYLSRALAVFGSILLEASFLKPTLKEVELAQSEASEHFREGVGSTLAVLRHFQNI